jgi:hypothetical protein
VLGRVHGWFDGAGWYVGLAVVLFVFALLAVLLELQSPDLVLWTGHRVTGTERGGIVTYNWDGQQYSLNATGYGSARDVGVYLDPANPGNAMINNLPDRIVVASFIGVPVAGGLALLVAGATLKPRHTRRKLRRAREFRL